MDLVRKFDTDRICVLGEEGLKKMDFQFLDEDFAFVFYDRKVTVTKEMDESFYNHFSKLFYKPYVFRDSLCYLRDKEISWVSDDYLGINQNEEDYNRVVMKLDNDSINFELKNNNNKRGVFIVKFAPMGMGKYSRNILDQTTFQEDVIDAFNTVLYDNVKTTGKKK